MSFILNFQKIKKLFFTVIYLLDISTLMVRGTQCNHTFVRWQFLRGKTKNVTRGLKFLEFQKIKKKICGIITVFLGDNEGVGTIYVPPHSSYIQKPCKITVKLKVQSKSTSCSSSLKQHPELRSTICSSTVAPWNYKDKKLLSFKVTTDPCYIWATDF